MAVGDTLAANVSEMTQELIALTQMQMPQVAPLMNMVERKTIPRGNNSVEIPRANATFNVATPADGDDLTTAEQFDLTSTTISPTLRAIRVRISERASRFSKEDVAGLVSQELARSQGQDVDVDISAEFANFTTLTDPGTTNTDLTLAVLRTARRELQANTVANGGPAPEPIFYVGAPIPIENLMTDLGVQGVVGSSNPWIPDGMSEDLIRSYFIPNMQLVGVNTFWDGYLTEDGSSDFITAMFSKVAITLAMSKDWDMKTFEESEFVGVILRTVADYNSAIGRYNAWGIAVTTDGA